MLLLLSHLATEVQATECVPAHEWNHFPGRPAYPYRDPRDGRCRDVYVLKGFQLPGLLLPVGTLDREDAHQHRFRVARDLVIDAIRVGVERLHIGPRGGTISRCPRWRSI